MRNEPATEWSPDAFPEEVATVSLVQGEPAKTIEGLLAECRFDPLNPPPEPVPLYSLGGVPIATPENVMAVQAKQKVGKSAVVGALLASTFSSSGDCLGFSSSNPNKHAVIHIDTEQSKFAHHRLIMRSVRRARHNMPPPWLRSYHLKGHSIGIMMAMLDAALRTSVEECGGIHSVIIDGIGDFCSDVNDQEEANALVAKMEAYATRYKTVVVCVIHENPSSTNGKTRGHLGTQLGRKAETNLRLEKDSDGITTMFADESRDVYIAKSNGPRFAWSDEEKAHVSVESVSIQKTDSKRMALEALASECFQNDGGVGLTYKQLTEQVSKLRDRTTATAERDIDKMKKLKVIRLQGTRYKLA